MGSLGSIFREVGRIKDSYPELHLRMVSVATSYTINHVNDLMSSGKDFGFEIFTVRQVDPPAGKQNFYYKENKYPVKDLAIDMLSFLQLKEKIIDSFGDKAEIEFSDIWQQSFYKKNKIRGNWELPTYKID